MVETSNSEETRDKLLQAFLASEKLPDKVLPALNVALTHKSYSNEVRQGFAIAMWGGAGMWLQADALAYTEASTSAFLTQAYCIILPLIALMVWMGIGSQSFLPAVSASDTHILEIVKKAPVKELANAR